MGVLKWNDKEYEGNQENLEQLIKFTMENFLR